MRPSSLGRRKKVSWNQASRGAGYLGRGGGAWHLSGFEPDREARSQPRVTVAGGSGGPIGYGEDRTVFADAASSSPIARP